MVPRIAISNRNELHRAARLRPKYRAATGLDIAIVRVSA